MPDGEQKVVPRVKSPFGEETLRRAFLCPPREMRNGPLMAGLAAEVFSRREAGGALKRRLL